MWDPNIFPTLLSEGPQSTLGGTDEFRLTDEITQAHDTDYQPKLVYWSV